MASLLPQRAGRRSNLALLGLLLVAGSTGVLAFGVGTTSSARVVTALHGAAGLGLLLLVPWKAVVVQRARTRPAGQRAPSTAWGLAGLTAVTVLTGVLHSAGATGPWVPGLPTLHLHVAAGVATGVLLVAHVWGRRQRPRVGDLSRRTLLRAGALGVGSVALWGAGEGLLRFTAAPGADRRATGSTERGSFQPDVMPVTQWFTDTVPESPHASVEVVVGNRRATVPVADLDGDDEVRAVIDCTGGWYAVQDWRGTRLDRLLIDRLGVELPADGSIDVISGTGYRRRLPARDAASLLLATHAAGRPLSAGHGAPVRLVAPGRRGFWWVKWVTRIEVVDAPWWAQPPFPLQ